VREIPYRGPVRIEGGYTVRGAVPEPSGKPLRTREARERPRHIHVHLPAARPPRRRVSDQEPAPWGPDPVGVTADPSGIAGLPDFTDALSEDGHHFASGDQYEVRDRHGRSAASALMRRCSLPAAPGWRAKRSRGWSH
jgi:hypothetical protein